MCCLGLDVPLRAANYCCDVTFHIEGYAHLDARGLCFLICGHRWLSSCSWLGMARGVELIRRCSHIVGTQLFFLFSTALAIERYRTRGIVSRTYGSQELWHVRTSLESPAPSIMDRRSVHEPFATGITAKVKQPVLCTMISRIFEECTSLHLWLGWTSRIGKLGRLIAVFLVHAKGLHVASLAVFVLSSSSLSTVLDPIPR